MYTRTIGRFITLTSLLLAAPACLDQSSPGPDLTAGAIRGVIVDGSGNPVPGARVIVDDLDGPVGFAGANGAFTLGGVSPGAHELHAIDDLGNRGATVRFELTTEEKELEPVEISPCEGGTAVQPCGQFDADPADPQLVIDELVLETQTGQVLAESLDVSGESSDRLTFLKFSVPGDFSGGGSLSLDDPGAAGVASLLSMIDANGAHFYTLVSGEIEIEVTAGGDAPGFQLTGTDLVLVYERTTGEIVPEYTVEIGSLTLAGQSTPADL